MKTVLILALLASPAAAGVVEFTCDQAALERADCYSEQLGKRMTMFKVTVEGAAGAQCPHDKANDPECQAARVVKALSPGWQMSVVCAQPLVDAGVCHRTMLGKKIGNPVGRVQFADKELRSGIWTLVSQDWKREAEALIGPPPPLLLDGKEVP